MIPFMSVLVLAGCLFPGSIGDTYCTVDDDTPVFSAPDLGSRIVTLVERNTCFNGDMEGEWLVLQDNPIHYIHGYTVNEDTESGADINGYQEYDPWYKQSVRSRCVDVEEINTCAGARSIPNNRQEKRFLMGDAIWTQWTSWSECDSTACNVEGTRNRTRQCYVLTPHVQANCNGGDTIEFQKCTKSCIVPCSDSYTWSLWHDCNTACDGITTRTGMCGNGTVNVTISEEKNCTRDLCPVDGAWSEWGTWGDCSTNVNLVQGFRFRYHQCLPTNLHGGADCQ
ncbi:thrombospondin-1-like [Dreissena polymorpha]|uniref:thrombospondin-1-like n=1 Tax=Dreissena polymorpha TaxID=45954 RepID=UPI0022640CC1|nr:thrombospondin-1-like [Dreissena polymorpha]